MYNRIAYLIGLAALALLAPGLAHAYGMTNPWRYEAAFGLWGPRVDGTVLVPFADSGYHLVLDPQDSFDNINLTFVGRFDARKGRWGLFLDGTYMDLDHLGPVDFIDLSGEFEDIDADENLEHTVAQLTFAGYFQAIKKRRYPMKVFIGGRALDSTSKLKWAAAENALLPPGFPQKGTGKTSYTALDGIAGVKGQWFLSKNVRKPWFVSYYADAGAGDSNLTWQTMLGLGYRLPWGDMILSYRYLDYDIKEADVEPAFFMEDFSHSGVQFEFTFRW